ncbi:hypothetical protein D8Y22_17305 [Salinadaptatus halalkaliphilus]|uniref:Uncharacterized protein n=1 Tax=Salinadaptatus halalkaliphilus TaxID=2419781 RepID=A0A4S3TLS3_9EURY|nr:hypothetical protein [Salinadaptatus halalkaliphilus]THE63578.1 hypothetical protein D8Y22_17305 [Salinadaptatus halalkaliphilus]
MIAAVRKWFREDGEWTLPDGRRGELIVLAIGLPVFIWFVHADGGLPSVGDIWIAGAIGTGAGYLYTGRYRERVVDTVPAVNGWTVVSLFAGGFGLSVLEVFYLADPAVAFLVAAGVTIAGIYAVRLVSPVHEGVQPPARGVEPPPALETDG